MFWNFKMFREIVIQHKFRQKSNNIGNVLCCRRYQDKSSAKHNLDEFLKGAYAKQMKELNGTTGKL